MTPYKAPYGYALKAHLEQHLGYEVSVEHFRTLFSNYYELEGKKASKPTYLFKCKLCADSPIMTHAQIMRH